MLGREPKMMVYVENLRRYQMQTKYWATKICRDYTNPISSLRTQIFGNGLMEARWKVNQVNGNHRQCFCLSACTVILIAQFVASRTFTILSCFHFIPEITNLLVIGLCLDVLFMQLMDFK
jgi:hypothetical protein